MDILMSHKISSSTKWGIIGQRMHLCDLNPGNGKGKYTEKRNLKMNLPIHKMSIFIVIFVLGCGSFS